MRRFLSVAAVSLGLLLAMAVVAELTFGTWFSKDPLDQLGLVRDRAVTVSPGPLYAGGADFLYRRDHWGFRGPGIDPAQITILTVGGSTTNQLYLPDDQTWQAVMERELQAAGREAVIANAGIDRQSSVGHLRAMADWLPNVPNLRPRFILFYVGLGDIYLGGSSVDMMQQSSRAKWIRQHSALIRTWERMSGAIAVRKAQVNHRSVDYAKAVWTDKPLHPEWRPDPKAIRAYKERLVRLAEMAHGMGAVPVLVTQPRGDYRVIDGKPEGMMEDGELNGLDHYRRLAEYNKAMRAGVEISHDYEIVELG